MVEPICPNDSDALSLHALGVLPEGERGPLEAHLDGCSSCAVEFASLRAVVVRIGAWPTDVLRPSPSMWDRLSARIAEDAEPPREGGRTTQPWDEPEWHDVGPLVACKILAMDRERKRVSMLVRLAPDGEYPPHRHRGVEELHLLHGELWINDRKLKPGDYNRAAPDTKDVRVWTATGCTCVLITSVDDELTLIGSA